VEAGVAIEEPGFRVQARASRVVRNLHFSARQQSQQLDRLQLSRLRKHRREHAQPHFSRRPPCKRLERIAEQPHTADRDERDHHVDAVSGGDLLTTAARGGGQRERG